MNLMKKERKNLNVVDQPIKLSKCLIIILYYIIYLKIMLLKNL